MSTFPFKPQYNPISPATWAHINVTHTWAHCNGQNLLHPALASSWNYGPKQSVNSSPHPAQLNWHIPLVIRQQITIVNTNVAQLTYHKCMADCVDCYQSLPTSSWASSSTEIPMGTRRWLLPLQGSTPPSNYQYIGQATTYVHHVAGDKPKTCSIFSAVPILPGGSSIAHLTKTFNNSTGRSMACICNSTRCCGRASLPQHSYSMNYRPQQYLVSGALHESFPLTKQHRMNPLTVQMICTVK